MAALREDANPAILWFIIQAEPSCTLIPDKEGKYPLRLALEGRWGTTSVSFRFDRDNQQHQTLRPPSHYNDACPILSSLCSDPCVVLATDTFGRNCLTYLLEHWYACPLQVNPDLVSLLLHRAPQAARDSSFDVFYSRTSVISPIRLAYQQYVRYARLLSAHDEAVHTMNNTAYVVNLVNANNNHHNAAINNNGTVVFSDVDTDAQRHSMHWWRIVQEILQVAQTHCDDPVNSSSASSRPTCATSSAVLLRAVIASGAPYLVVQRMLSEWPECTRDTSFLCKGMAQSATGFYDRTNSLYDMYETPLHMACRKASRNKEQVVILLVRHDPSQAGRPDREGRYPLHLIAESVGGLATPDMVRRVLYAYPTANRCIDPRYGLPPVLAAAAQKHSSTDGLSDPNNDRRHLSVIYELLLADPGWVKCYG
jgi:Ankyrin repeat